MKVRSVWSLLLVFALLLAACGGGDEPAADVTPIPTVAPLDTPAAADTPTAEATATVDATSPLTGTEETTGSEEITGVDEITGTDTLTAEADVGTNAGINITDTEVLTDMEEITTTETVTGADTGMIDTAADRGVIRASELLDYNVENAQNEDLGSVEDAMVSLQDGCINYLVLSFGGVLGLADNQYLIPWRAIAVQPQLERLQLNVDQAVLEDAPIFDVDNLPDMTLPDWDADLTTYWENIAIITPDTPMPTVDTTMGMTETDNMTGTDGITDTTAPLTETMTDTMAGADTMMVCGMGTMTESTTPAASAGSAVTDTINVESVHAIRLSQLLDYAVVNPEGEDLGTIEDMMVDWREDRLAYGILSFGGFLGLGDKWFILPLDALTLDAVEQRFVFDAEPERLEAAPGFDPDALPDTLDPNWDEEIRQYWEQNQ